MLLADLGADVVKIERPAEGDDTRHWGPPFAGGDAAYFLSLNRNKRSVTADLGTPEGVSFVRRLIERADVVIENFRPGLMARFGLGLEELRQAHPRLVTCSLTAFGADATETASRPGYDIIMQALSGLMSVTGERDGEPTKAGVALLDVITGLYAAVGILAALRERDATGRGRHVSVALFDASVSAMVNQAANYLIGGVVPARMGTAHPNIVPYQSFHASDRPFILAAGNDRLFARTCEVIERPDWASDERFATNEARVANRDALIPLLQERFAEQTGRDVADDARSGRRSLFAHPHHGRRLLLARRIRARRGGPDAVRGMLRLVANPIRFDGVAPPTPNASPAARRARRLRVGGRVTANGPLARAARGVGDPGRDPRCGSRASVGLLERALRSAWAPASQPRRPSRQPPLAVWRRFQKGDGAGRRRRRRRDVVAARATSRIDRRCGSPGGHAGRLPRECSGGWRRRANGARRVAGRGEPRSRWRTSSSSDTWSTTSPSSRHSSMRSMRTPDAGWCSSSRNDIRSSG